MKEQNQFDPNLDSHIYIPVSNVGIFVNNIVFRKVPFCSHMSRREAPQMNNFPPFFMKND